MASQLFHLIPIGQWSTVIVPLTSIYIVARTIRSCRRRRALPPGPRRYPIFGNALQVPRTHLWLKVNEWAKQYGEYHLFSSLTTPALISYMYRQISRPDIFL